MDSFLLSSKAFFNKTNSFLENIIVNTTILALYVWLKQINH